MDDQQNYASDDTHHGSDDVGYAQEQITTSQPRQLRDEDGLTTVEVGHWVICKLY